MGSHADSLKWREIIFHAGDDWPDYRLFKWSNASLIIVALYVDDF
jgi:hypothetical protein